MSLLPPDDASVTQPGTGDKSETAALASSGLLTFVDYFRRQKKVWMTHYDR